MKVQMLINGETNLAIMFVKSHNSNSSGNFKRKDKKKSDKNCRHYGGWSLKRRLFQNTKLFGVI